MERLLNSKNRLAGFLAALGPGILLAATGVGAGDLATASFTGNKLGTSIVWAVFLGAFIKFVLNEGIARWQLATGDTLIEGAMRRFGRPMQISFLLYLIAWSFFVGSALISACGVAAHAIFPLGADAAWGKIVWGVMHSIAGVCLVRAGGYKLFEKVMMFSIGMMFLTVVCTAVLLQPDWSAVLSGIFIPRIPEGGVTWTVALMGGVGGTLTVLCYGYWIRESGRIGIEALKICRIDLAAGYTMTAIFSVAMVIIGSKTDISGRGAGLIVDLANRLEAPLGSVGRWSFLWGAWAAIASSLLGVWQSVPYLFADSWSLYKGETDAQRSVSVCDDSPLYRGYLYALASIPAAGLVMSFREIQKLYAVVGALFIPLLAIVLLILNGRADLVGMRWKNGAGATFVLFGAILFFAYAGWLKFH